MEHDFKSLEKCNIFLSSILDKYLNLNALSFLNELKLKKYQCVKCFKVLSSCTNYKKHIKSGICTRPTVFSCNICNKMFKSRQNLQYHLKNNVCSKNDLIENNPIVNPKEQNKKINFSCEHCKRILSSNLNYKKHIRSNICKEKIFSCDKCNKIFQKKQKLQYHIENNVCNKNKSTLIQLAETNTVNPIDETIINPIVSPIDNLIDETIVNPIDNPTDNLDKEQNKKYKKVKISLPLKKAVWYKYVGCDIGSVYCFCCGLNKLTQLDFTCGHVSPESKGGLTNVDNLLPICGSCNSSMGSLLAKANKPALQGNKHMFKFMLSCGFKVSHLLKLVNF